MVPFPLDCRMGWYPSSACTRVLEIVFVKIFVKIFVKKGLDFKHEKHLDIIDHLSYSCLFAFISHSNGRWNGCNFLCFAFNYWVYVLD